MADSGTYDETTMARRYAMAQHLMESGQKPITHWAQGLASIANSALGGYQIGALDEERKAEKAAGKAELFSALGLPAPAAAAPEPNGLQKIASLLRGGAGDAPAAPVAPSVAPPVSAPTTPPSAPTPPVAAPVAPGPMSAVTPPVARAPVEPIPDIIRTNPDGSIAGNITAPTVPAGGKIAAALNPPTDVSAIARPPAGGILAGVSPETKLQIAQMLSSQNPTMKALGMSAISQVTKQDTPINVGGKLVTPQGKVVYEGGEEKPKWGIVGKDKYGQPVYGYPPTREEAAAKGAEKPAAPEADMAGLSGKEYMDTLKKDDPKMESQVRAVLEGRAPYPTGMLLKTPYGQQLAAHVTQADPSFESGNATARVKTRNEFMTGSVGSPAGQITAGNTALQHAGEMSDALERFKEGGGVMRGLGNAGIPVVSYAANTLKNKSVQGTPEGAALNDFMTAKNHFSEEVTKFYAGSAGSEAERTRALANLDAAKSLPELRSAIKTEVNLMQGKVNALQDRWKNGMGPLVPEFPLIQPKSQEAIDRVIQRHQASEQPAQAAGGTQTATNPKTGEKIILKDGQWVPLK